LLVKQDGTYYAGVSNPCGTVTDSTTIRFQSCEPELFVPNAFSPDQDGVNDFFLAYGVNISSFTMQVYNRWGELLYESHNLTDGWDGSKNGKACPPDVYVWIINYESAAADIPVQGTLKGNVMLVR
jgi:gliding motility-associated-like protein